MRNVSLQRQHRNKDARPVRETLLAENPRCDWCGKVCGPLDVHEIARGGGLREKQLDKRYALLVLGRACHDTITRMAGDDARLCGLAILCHVRSSDYSLSSFVRLLWPEAPNKITQRDVDPWISRLALTGPIIEPFSREVRELTR